MRLFSREASRYAALLIILFAIAALAVWHTLSLLLDRLISDDFIVIASLICVIVFGFMLIAGAFGLWAIQFSARDEARRRVGQLVDAMDYLTDGVLAVDAKLGIIGGNPAAHVIAGKPDIRGLPLREAFEFLGEPDAHFLLNNEEAVELERPARQENTRLRFRSLPSDGVTLLLVSDVTSLEARREASRQSARLQLIGEISRGVAHDFNNLLCSISGHTSLLPRLLPGSPDFTTSVNEVNRAVEKGTALAGHLIELTRPMPSALFSPMTIDSLRYAVDGLKDTIRGDWTFDVNLKDLPPMALSHTRIEQIVTNLGGIASDQAGTPGTLSIWACAPNRDHQLFDIDPAFAAVLIITTGGVLEATWEAPTETEYGSSGVILPVIRSMLEQSGGQLDLIFTANGTPIYRVCIPMATAPAGPEGTNRIAAELGPYLANWTVLLAVQKRSSEQIEMSMREMKIVIDRVESLPALLSKVEGGQSMDAIVVEKALVNEETNGIIKAIIKLCPKSAVVVISPNPEQEDVALRQDAALLPANAAADKIMLALVEAKALAVRRKRTADA
ncbi:MAG: signal transduction histidine kinase [Candidatus Promineifilaceae bacterium]|jgi:signal transduction histidine kinase